MTVAKRPLVTFALFAYNQERFIAEAVKSAFAQDYSPLEIIISDDGSTDQTFGIIQEMARSYDGPHTVVVRRTSKNCGTLLHVADVAKSAKGSLLVLAAGDDVSKASRVRILQEHWKRTGAWGLCSRFDRMGADGVLIAEGVQSSVIGSHGFDKYFFPEDGAVQVVHGCTSAYDKRTFEYLKLEDGDYVLSEDGAISVLLNLMGKTIAHLDESLVLYRESPGSLTNSSASRALTYSEIDRDEANIERFADSQANRCRLFLRMNAQLEEKVRAIRVAGVRVELELQENKKNWYKLSVAERVACILQNRVSRKWAIPRLFGKKPFYCMKWIASRAH